MPENKTVVSYRGEAKALWDAIRRKYPELTDNERLKLVLRGQPDPWEVWIEQLDMLVDQAEGWMERAALRYVRMFKATMLQVHHDRADVDVLGDGLQELMAEAKLAGELELDDNGNGDVDDDVREILEAEPELPGWS